MIVVHGSYMYMYMYMYRYLEIRYQASDVMLCTQANLSAFLPRRSGYMQPLAPSYRFGDTLRAGTWNAIDHARQ
jgi:hypothetical protein